LINWLKKAQVSPWKASSADLDAAVKPDLRTGNTFQHQKSDESFSGLQVKLPLPEGRE
jgi:hypothetical protein